MKCQKCKTGIMRSDVAIGGEVTSHYCLICGYRTYRDFTVRQPVITADPRCDGPRIDTPRRPLSAKDKAIIAEQRAAGQTMRKIAELLNRPEGSICNYIRRTLKGDQLCSEPSAAISNA